MKLLAHAEDHLAQDFPPGATHFNLFQFKKVQRSCKEFLKKYHVGLKNKKE